MDFIIFHSKKQELLKALANPTMDADYRYILLKALTSEEHSEVVQPLENGEGKSQQNLKKIVEEEQESLAESAAYTLCMMKKQLSNMSQVGSDVSAKVQNIKATESSGVRKRKEKDDVSSHVEILDSAEALKGNFGPSKYNWGISNKSGRSYEHSEFGKNVLNAMKKPFDEEEYLEHQKAVQVYLDSYQDLKAKLAKYEYDKTKSLMILRGFFFWLQNLTQTEAFQPWTDSECLNVELESG